MALSVGEIEATLRLKDQMTAQLRKVGGDLNRMGQNLQWVGMKAKFAGLDIAIGLTAPIVAAGTASATFFADFERGMNRLRALTGVGKLSQDFKNLEAQAMQLGATTVYTARQAADAMGFFALAGFKVNEIMAAMPGTLQLAVAGQMQVGQAADITAKIMRGYGLEVSQVARMNDVLTKAFTSANTDLIQLGHAFKYAGPVARSAGMEFEEAAATLALFGDAGFQATLGGTALRGAISRMLAPTKEMRGIMKELGLEFTDASGRMLPMVDIIRQLEPHAEKTGQIMELFGLRAGPAMASLIQRGSDELGKFTQMLREAGGTAEKIEKIQLEGLRGAWILFESAFEGVAISIGAVLAPALQMMLGLLTKVAQWIQFTLVPWFKELPKAVQVAVGVFLALAAAIGPLTIAFGTLAVMVGAGMSAIGGLVAAYAVFRASIGAGLGVMAAMKASLAELFGLTTAHAHGIYTSAAAHTAHTAAVGANTAAVGTASVVTANNTLITRAATIAKNAEMAAINMVTGSAIAQSFQMAANSVAKGVNTAATWASTTAHGALTAAMNLVTGSAVGQGVAMAASRVATVAASLAAGAGAVAFTALGAAILAVKWVLIPLIAGFAGWKLGEKIREVELFGLQLQDWVPVLWNWKLGLGEMSLEQLKFSEATRRAMIENEKNIEVLEAERAAYDALLKRLTGQDIQEEVNRLARATLELTNSGKATRETLLRIGEAAERLRDNGAQLNPQLQGLASWVAEIGGRLPPTIYEFDRATGAIIGLSAAVRNSPMYKGNKDPFADKGTLDTFSGGLFKLVAGAKEATTALSRGGGGLTGATDAYTDALDKLAKKWPDAIAQAKAWVDHVGSAGAVTKLTIDEQEQLRDTLQELVDKYGSLDKVGRANTQAIYERATALHVERANIKENQKALEDQARTAQALRAIENDLAVAKMEAAKQNNELLRNLRFENSQMALKAVQNDLQAELDAIARRANEYRTLYQLRGLENKALLDEITKNEQLAADAVLRAWTEANVKLAEVPKERVSQWKPMLGGLFDVFKNIPNKLSQAFTGGGGFKGAFKAIGVELSSSLFGGLFAKGTALNDFLATNMGKGISKLTGLGVTGVSSALAKAIPFIGEAIAALLPSIIGMFKKPEWKKVMKDVGRDWGVDISEELAKSIEKDSKRLGDRVAATLLHIGDIFKEAGGVAAFGFEKAIQKTKDLFVQLETGKLTVKEVGKAFDDAFGQIAAEVTGLASKGFLELIELAKRFGVESKAMAEFLSAQAGKIIGGFNAIAQAFVAPFKKWIDISEDATGATDKLYEKQQALIATIKDLESNTNRTARQENQLRKAREDLAVVTFHLARTNGDWAKAQEELTRTLPDLQAGFDRMGRLAVIAFNAALANGRGLIETLKEMGPGLDALIDAQERFGLVSSAAFDELKQFRQFIKDNEELAASIDGLNQMMIGLHNSGLLTQDMFDDLTATAVDTFNKIVEQGLTGDQALRLMQPTLQTIWELQKDFGFAVDEATQKLIDQAVEAGLVGDKHRDVNERIARGIERIGEILETVFADKLPKAIGRTEEALGRIPRRIGIDVVYNSIDDVPAPSPDGLSEYAHGTRNLDYEYFGAGTPVALHGSEAVIPQSGVGDFAAQVASELAGMMSGGGGSSVQFNVTTPIATVDSIRQMFYEELGPILIDWLNDNRAGARTKVQQALGIDET